MISLNTGCSAHDFLFANHKTLVKLGKTQTIVLCVFQERSMVWGRGFYEGSWRRMVSGTTALFGSMASFFLPLAPIVIHCIYVIMSAMASQNTGISIVFFKPFVHTQIKEISKLRATGLCEGTSPVTNEFPARRTSNAEDVSISFVYRETRQMLYLSIHMENSPPYICQNKDHMKAESSVMEILKSSIGMNTYNI